MSQSMNERKRVGNKTLLFKVEKGRRESNPYFQSLNADNKNLNGDIDNIDENENEDEDENCNILDENKSQKLNF